MFRWAQLVQDTHSAIIKNTRNVLAIEALCALTGCTIRGKELMASKTRTAVRKDLLTIVDPIDEDRIFTARYRLQLNNYLKNVML